MQDPYRRLGLLKVLTLTLGLLLLASRNASPQTAEPQNAELDPPHLSARREPLGESQNPIVIPAGTTIVLRLDSPLNSESASTGSGVYAETVFPVLVNGHVAIPARTFVQGTVTSEKRGGHFSRKSAIAMHFNSFVLGNTYSVAVDGGLQSIPGAEAERADGDKIQRTDQLDKALPPVAGGAVAGAVLGSVRHSGVGTWPGAALGAGLGLGSVLIMRGGAVRLVEGQKIEMVLNAPLTVDAAQVREASLRTNASYANTGFPNERARQHDGNTPQLQRRPAKKPIVPGFSPFNLLWMLAR